MRKLNTATEWGTHTMHIHIYNIYILYRGWGWLGVCDNHNKQQQQIQRQQLPLQQIALIHEKMSKCIRRGLVISIRYNNKSINNKHYNNNNNWQNNNNNTRYTSSS